MIALAAVFFASLRLHQRFFTETQFSLSSYLNHIYNNGIDGNRLNQCTVEMSRVSACACNCIGSNSHVLSTSINISNLMNWT